MYEVDANHMDISTGPVRAFVSLLGLVVMLSGVGILNSGSNSGASDARRTLEVIPYIILVGATCLAISWWRPKARAKVIIVNAVITTIIVGSIILFRRSNTDSHLGPIGLGALLIFYSLVPAKREAGGQS